MKIATWNINSVNSRLPHLLKWLDDAQPDIVLLQEIKCVDEKFPAMEIEERGYNLAVHGQKSYNGVAILSKFPLDDITRGLPGDDSDEQARYIEAVASIPINHSLPAGESLSAKREAVGGKEATSSPHDSVDASSAPPQGGSSFFVLRVASIYVPNGQSPDSDKFTYKLAFFDRLYAHAHRLLEYDEMLVLGGDYNCAPQPQDVYDPEKLDGTVCYHPKEREKLRSIEYLGLYDAFRMEHPHKHQFSFWDYRAGAYQAGKGYRIDHLLLSPQAADRLTACEIDETPRSWDKPSDHAPVVGELAASF